jgi:hypothetical protein
MEESAIIKKRQRQKEYQKRTKYAANLKWKKRNIIRISFELNKDTDKKLVQKMESLDNKNGYLKQLIRQDIDINY